MICTVQLYREIKQWKIEKTWKEFDSTLISSILGKVNHVFVRLKRMFCTDTKSKVEFNRTQLNEINN